MSCSQRAESIRSCTNGSCSKKSLRLPDHFYDRRRIKTLENDLDKRYQTLVVLWSALLLSVGMYFLFLTFAAPRIHNEPANRSSLLIVALITLGLFLVIACAMCEVSALLGFLERLIIGNREYYWLFLFAAGGIALHFPGAVNWSPP